MSQETSASNEMTADTEAGWYAADRVWEASRVSWHKAAENEMSRKIHGILQKWIPYASGQFAEWPDRPNCGHFFGGSYWYGMETGYTIIVFAVIATLGEYDEAVTGMPREEVKRKAIHGIRYLGFTHDTGPEDCVRAEGRNPFCSKTKWGGKGKVFFSASQNGMTIVNFGIAALLLWDELDDETKILVQNVVSSYADRWCEEEPRNGTYNDTQAEENGWTSAGIAVAIGLFPNHPHYEKWKNGFMNWSINSITTFKDKISDNSSRTGVPVKRIKTVTFHPDFTTENHGFAHPTYMCAGMVIRGVHAVFSLMTDQPILDSILYNNEALYERMVKIWSQRDGQAVPVQGQDWWYNRQHEIQVAHTLMNVLYGKVDAARLERNAFDTIAKLQDSNSKGCFLEENGEECVITKFQSAKDMEHVSAHDMATSYLLHAFGGPGVEPSRQEELDQRLSGVYYYPYGSVVIHRTKDSFSCFSWRNNVMGLTLPANGNWTITPLPASYIGNMKLEPGESPRNIWAYEWRVIDAEKEHIRRYSDGFGAVVTLARGDGELLQDAAFVSLPNGKSFYAEQFHVLKPCTAEQLNTGMIGIRNERYSGLPDWAPGERTIYFPEGSDTFTGFYGKEPNLVKTYPSADYVNVDGEIGYVLFGSRGIQYINKHEYPKWKGVEDILILNHYGKQEFAGPQTLQPFAVLTAPNETRADTSRTADAACMLSCDRERVIMVETDGFLTHVNFHSAAQIVQARRELAALPKVQLFAGHLRLAGGVYTWSGKLEAFESGYFPSEYTLRLQDGEWDGVSLDIAVLADRLIFTNLSGSTVGLLLHRSDEADRTLEIAAGATAVMET